MHNEELKTTMTIDMHGKASVVIVDDRTDEEREADTLRRVFERQRRVHSQTNPMPFSAIDMITIARSQG